MTAMKKGPQKLYDITWDAQRPAHPLQFTHRLTGQRVILPVLSPRLKFRTGEVGGTEPDGLAVRTEGRDTVIAFQYPPESLEGTTIRFASELHLPADGSCIHWIPSFTVQPSRKAKPLHLRRVELLRMPQPGHIESVRPDTQSYPVFTRDLFLGVEWPVATAEREAKELVFSCKPETAVPANRRWSRRIVIGFCGEGNVIETFRSYISRFRRQPDQIHFNYNSWWTLGYPFSERQVLGLWTDVERHLLQPHSVHFDTCTLDLGWSGERAIWQPHPVNFPKGFSALNCKLDAMGSRLGIWWSPSNCYSPHSFDAAWAAQAGYEARSAAGADRTHAMCIAQGHRYQKECLKTMVSHTRKHRLAHTKFDALLPDCPEAGHNHQPGTAGRESIYNGLIEIFEAMRKANPRLLMEVHCFGPHASPWWLMFADALVGGVGDDYPHGCIPAPNYRDACTTSRDFFHLQHSRHPIPARDYDLFGMIVQTQEPQFNDGIMVLMRGQQFNSFYLNPKMMNPTLWAFVGQLMNWGRANWSLLRNTRMIPPRAWQGHDLPSWNDLQAMPREPYGYSHWSDDEVLIALRNPWMDMADYTLDLTTATLGTDRDLSGWSAFQVWPEPRLLATDLRPARGLPLRLGPYETRIIRLRKVRTRTRITPCPLKALQRRVTIARANSSLRSQHDKPDQMLWEARIDGRSQGSTMLRLLIESPQPIQLIRHEVRILEQPTFVDIQESKYGWQAAQPGWQQRHWLWCTVELPQGPWAAVAALAVQGTNLTVRAWVIAREAASPSPIPHAWQTSPAFPIFPDCQREASLRIDL